MLRDDLEKFFAAVKQWGIVSKPYLCLYFVKKKKNGKNESTSIN